jgi:predicted metalloenzyme YecM
MLERRERGDRELEVRVEHAKPPPEGKTLMNRTINIDSNKQIIGVRHPY